MEIGFIGLGRMGRNMGIRLARAGHRVVGCDPTAEARASAAEEGLEVAATIPEMVALLKDSPRVLWAMVPAGAVTESVLKEAAAAAAPGDILIDGGNSNYKDSRRRAAEMTERGLRFLDAGTSGGVWGLQNGYCLMVGGPADAFAPVEPLIRDLAPPDGYRHVGGPGAGHFAKMIHNGIEYGMLQAYAEGFEILHAATEYEYDLAGLANLWNHGSVVRSWLLELSEQALAGDQNFSDLQDDVADSGEGRWTVQEAIDRNVPAPVITLSLQVRLRTRQDESYAGKFIAALRNQFGGHAVTAAIREKIEPGSVPSGGKHDL